MREIAPVPVFESQDLSASSLPGAGTAHEPLSARLSAASNRRETARRRDAIYRRALALADMAAVAFAVVGCVAWSDDGLTALAFAVPLVFVAIVKAMGLYDRDQHLLHRSTLDEVPALFGLATLAALLLWLANGSFVDGELGRLQVLVAWGSLFLSLICFRALGRTAAGRLTPVERCLLLGPHSSAAFIREKLALSPAVQAEMVGAVEPIDSSGEGPAQPPSNLGSILDEHAIERVILATGAHRRDELLYTIRELKTYGVKVSVLPEASRVAGSSVELDHLHGVTLLGMRRFEFTRSSRLIKRSFDLAGSAVGLLFLLPVLGSVAVAIRLDSRGPILFRQQRVGRHGDLFTMLKFRSMVNEAEQQKVEMEHLNRAASGLFKIPADPRLTRVGRVIRRWQLDEVPQLVNVLRGEMSLVGPRPLIPSEDSQIEGWYRRRLDVPPGMTGHWQILGSSARIPIDEMVKLDYLYVANWSLWGDITLLLRTIPFLARRRGV